MGFSCSAIRAILFGALNDFCGNLANVADDDVVAGMFGAIKTAIADLAEMDLFENVSVV